MVDVFIPPSFRFTIVDVPAEKSYQISASFAVCYGVGTCIIDKTDLLTNYKLPKSLCEWGSGFKIPGNN